MFRGMEIIENDPEKTHGTGDDMSKHKRARRIVFVEEKVKIRPCPVRPSERWAVHTSQNRDGFGMEFRRCFRSGSFAVPQI